MIEFLQQNIVWAGLAAVSGGMLVWQAVRGGGNNISVTEATVMLNREEAVVVDVREAHEWSAGHIPNARHIALGQFSKRIPELDRFKARPLIVVCARGNRSSSACGALKRAGFEKVFNLSGGLDAWAGANLPLTTKS